MKRSPEHRAKLSRALKGRKHSPETRAKMSQAHKGRKFSPETRAKMSRAAKRRWLRPGFKARMSKAMKGREFSPEHRAKLSRAAVLAIKEGRVHPGQSRGVGGEFYSKKNGRTFHYRSQLELHWYQLLEKMTKVKKYRTEPYMIPYKWEGAVHHYLPDLQIRYTDGTEELIEVKPEADIFRGDLRNQAKWKAARRWCKDRNRSTKFRVVGYEELN